MLLLHHSVNILTEYIMRSNYGYGLSKGGFSRRLVAFNMDVPQQGWALLNADPIA